MKYALVIVALVVGFMSGVMYEKGQASDVTGAVVKSEGTTSEETKGLPADFRAKLAAFATVPEDALIARIDDADLVRKSQPEVYRNARNGDYVIIFGDVVIVYDYHNNKMIDTFKVK